MLIRLVIRKHRHEDVSLQRWQIKTLSGAVLGEYRTHQAAIDAIDEWHRHPSTFPLSTYVGLFDDRSGR